MRPILIIILFATAATAAVAFMMDWEARTAGETTGTENAPSQTQTDTGDPGGEQPPSDGQKALNAPTERVGRSAEKRETTTLKRSEPAPPPRTTSRQPSGTARTEKKPAKSRAPEETPAMPPRQNGQRDAPPKETPARKENAHKKSNAENPDRIDLPPILRGVRFGTSPDPIRDHYEVAWHRQTRDKLMLVHYPRGSDKAQIRFHFGRDIGLKKIEMRFKESSKKGAVGLYKEIQQTFGRKYGALPESGSSRWADEHLKVRLKRHGNQVILTFQLA
jgi:hypothetical protein